MVLSVATEFLRQKIPTYLASYLGLTSYKALILTIGLPLVWYSLGLISIVVVRKYMFNTGYYISQSCKKVPYWDRYVEPIFIRQFTIFFTASHSLIEGMVSDNEDSEEIVEEMKKMKESILEDFEAYKGIEESDQDESEKEERKEKIKERIDSKIDDFIFKFGVKKE